MNSSIWFCVLVSLCDLRDGGDLTDDAVWADGAGDGLEMRVWGVAIVWRC